MLIDGKVNMEATDEDGCTALHHASMEGHVECLRVLIDSKVNMEATDKLYGWTALHWASRNGHVECLQELTDAGARIQAVDNEGRNALHLAALSCKSDKIMKTLSKLLQLGVEKDALTSEGEKPVDMVEKNMYGLSMAVKEECRKLLQVE